MEKNVTAFLLKVSLLSAPILFIVMLYLIFDPFKVLYTYSSYFNSNEPCYVTLNRDYVSTETFIQNYPTYKYDSFIFGNSRSLFYEMEDWKKHITSDRCFHFDASSETVYGIYRKIIFLKENNIPIKNALIILDASALYEISDSRGHLFIKHPKLSGRDKYSFQLEFFRAFCTPNFLKTYTQFRFFDIKSSMLDYHIWNYNSINNELKSAYDEKQIQEDEGRYYRKKERIFYKRDTIQSYSPPMIGARAEKMWYEISEKLKKDSAIYKIIISPLYDQKKINVSDLNILKKVFEEKNIYDYSGINEITNNVCNYYETSHYRPHITKLIIDEVYKNNKPIE